MGEEDADLIPRARAAMIHAPQPEVMFHAPPPDTTQIVANNTAGAGTTRSRITEGLKMKSLTQDAKQPGWLWSTNNAGREARRETR